ncbi:hypothetical protein [Paenibacillus gorillae]|uniref:hypothetical protein n=1 Tax=Paenibacillus gorillae TaxID=1243662 RepID=UPI0004B735E7|nr:hypothetical protein [Paenibacillus gorillae]
MCNKHSCLWMGIIVLVSICLTACESNNAKVVSKAVPSGFISLKEAIDDTNGSLRYMPWESQIAFLDADNITIYQTGFDNRGFIVKYKGEYYINEEKYSDLVKIANLTMEQRNQTYHLGDTVGLRKSATEQYAVKVDAVEVETVDEVGIYTIKFSVDHVDYAYQRKQFFDHFETKNGRRTKDSTVLNEGTVQIKLLAGDKIRMIVLKSPDYDECIRRVSIEE